ncbi:LRRC14B [Branchiostoma lanceolatum]|nr:LRRC14B [Branchiostoma lanceolatum]
MMGEPAVGGVKAEKGSHQRFGTRPQKNQAVQESGRGTVAVGAGGNKFAAMRARFERGAAGEGENKPPPPRRRGKDSSMKRPDSWILQDKTEDKTADKTGRLSRTEDDKNASAEKHKLSSDRTVHQKTTFSRGKTTEDRLGPNIRKQTDSAPEPPARVFPRSTSRENVLKKTTASSDDVETRTSDIRKRTDRAPDPPARVFPRSTSRENVLKKSTPSSEDVETTKTSNIRKRTDRAPDPPARAFPRSTSRENVLKKTTASSEGVETSKTSNIRERTDRAPDPPARAFPRSTSRENVLKKTPPSWDDVETSKTSKPHRELVNGVPEERKRSEMSSISTPKVATEKFAEETVLSVAHDKENMVDTDIRNPSDIGDGGNLTTEVVFVDVSSEGESEPVPRAQTSSRVQSAADVADVQVKRPSPSRRRRVGRHDAPDVNSYELHISENGTSDEDVSKANEKTESPAKKETPTPAPRRNRVTPRRDVDDATSVRTDDSNGVDDRESVLTTQSRHKVNRDVEKVGLNGTSTSMKRRYDVSPHDGVDAENGERRTPARTDDTNGVDVNVGDLIQKETATQRRRNVDVDVDLEKNSEKGAPTRHRSRMTAETGDIKKGGEKGTSTQRWSNIIADVDVEKPDEKETSTRRRSMIAAKVNDAGNFGENGAPTRRHSHTADVNVEINDKNGAPTPRRSRIAEVDVEKNDGNRTSTQRRSRIADVDVNKNDANGASTQRRSKIVDIDVDKNDENGAPMQRSNRIADVDVVKNDENEAVKHRLSRMADVDAEKNDENGAVTQRRSKVADVDVEKNDEDVTSTLPHNAEVDDAEKSGENGAPTQRRGKIANFDVNKNDANGASTQRRSKIADVDAEKTDENGAPTQRHSRITRETDGVKKIDENGGPTQQRSKIADVDVEKIDENGAPTRRRSRITRETDGVDKPDENGGPTRRRSRIAAEINDVDAELARPRYRRRDRDAADADLDVPTRRQSRNGDAVTSVASSRGRTTLLPEDGTLELNSAAYGKVATLQWGFRAPGYADRLERRRPLEKMNGDEMALRGALLSGDADKIKDMVSTWPHKVLDFRNVYGQSGISPLQNGHVGKDQSEEVAVFPKRPIEYSNPAVSWSRDVTKAVVEGLTTKNNSGFQAVCMQNVLPDKDMTNDLATAALDADSQDCKMEGTLDVYLNVWLKWGYSNSEKLTKALAAGRGEAARMRLHASSAVVHRAHRCYKFVGELINTLDPEVTTGFEVYENEADLEEKFKDIVKLKNLTSLTLAGCLPDGTSPEYLQTLVSSMPNLRRLDVRRNPLTGWFAELLGTASPLQYLNIAQCGVSQIDLYFLANSHHIGQLEELDLSGTDLTGLLDDVTQLLLQASGNLKWLGMADCNLGAHAQIVLELLEKLPYLEEWDLNDNEFSEEDVCKIVEACAKAPGFRFLKITPPATVNSADPKEGSKEVRRFDGLVKAALRRACADEDRKMRCLVTYKLPEYKDEPPTLI